MGKVIVGTTMSLDGFINDRNGNVSRLYPDLEALRKTDLLAEAIETTDAVVMGRHAYAMGDPDTYADAYEYQVPIFVLTHAVPEKRPKESDRLTFTLVTSGIERTCKRQGNSEPCAGGKHVIVIGGANTAQQCIRARLCDEIQIGIIPILLGEGLRFFEHPGGDPIELEKIKVIESSARTDLWFRVIK